MLCLSVAGASWGHLPSQRGCSLNPGFLLRFRPLPSLSHQPGWARGEVGVGGATPAHRLISPLVLGCWESPFCRLLPVPFLTQQDCSSKWPQFKCDPTGASHLGFPQRAWWHSCPRTDCPAHQPSASFPEPLGTQTPPPVPLEDASKTWADAWTSRGGHTTRVWAFTKTPCVFTITAHTEQGFWSVLSMRYFHPVCGIVIHRCDMALLPCAWSLRVYTICAAKPSTLYSYTAPDFA